MHFKIQPREVFIKLLYLIFVLLFFNVIGIISKVYFHHENVHGLVPLFNFDTENNIPTLYSSVALLFASTLLLVIAIANKKNGSPYLSWLGLSVIFLFLSIDEVASIHETLDVPVRRLLGTSGVLRLAWVIPYGVALIVFAFAYLRFLVRLPANIMILFIVSGATYVSGAIGFELFGYWWNLTYGYDYLVYSFFYTCEEFLEMLGIVIFIYTLLTYILGQFKSLTITVDE